MVTNKFFPEIHGNFGFGLMRLPMLDKEVDLEQTKEMADAFLAAGLNYFDTAHGYIGGRSETAFRDAVAARYPRDRFLLTNKLSGPFFEKEEDILPLFEQQLAACGVEYFDFFLMHSQTAGNYGKFKACRAYETAFALKEQGRVRHVGISFHDKASLLEQILTDYPQIEVVQIQFNYADYEDPSVESRKVYEVCEKFGKPVIVMEPVKGGNLINLPEEAQRVFDELGGGSNASYAIRFAAGFPNMCMVLSGMSTREQMADNLNFMEDFRPLSDAERAAVDKVCAVFKSMDLIPCTACSYCTDGCPMGIRIPRLFSCMNNKKRFKDWNAYFYYEISTKDAGKASDCVGCGQCEEACPQHLPIRELLQDVAAEFEKGEN
jgi:predicted aldo/keto reductase-like oxidoreductase